ncbi:MAG: hypothetical protein KA034_01000 [Candidatus Moranbacteria bacterium]|nr:hypothetical protein [Candidatus Moranbacteria bacterium]
MNTSDQGRSLHVRPKEGMCLACGELVIRNFYCVRDALGGVVTRTGGPHCSVCGRAHPKSHPASTRIVRLEEPL